MLYTLSWALKTISIKMGCMESEKEYLKQFVQNARGKNLYKSFEEFGRQKSVHLGESVMRYKITKTAVASLQRTKIPG